MKKTLKWCFMLSLIASGLSFPFVVIPMFNIGTILSLVISIPFGLIIGAILFDVSEWKV